MFQDKTVDELLYPNSEHEDSDVLGALSKQALGSGFFLAAHPKLGIKDKCAEASYRGPCIAMQAAGNWF